MDLYPLTDRAVLAELGARIRRRRLARNWAQATLATRAGLNRTTVGDLERGHSCGTLTLVRVLRALDALEDLDAMLPDPGPSPIQLAKLRGRERKRASSRVAEAPPEADVRGRGTW